MKKQQLKSLIHLTGLSPEELGPYFGMSNMTLRRAIAKTGKPTFSEGYRANLREGVLALVKDGKIDPQSKIAQECLMGTSTLYSESIFSILNIPPGSVDKINRAKKSDIQETLIEIGKSKKRQQEVDSNIQEIKHLGVKNPSILTPAKYLLKIILNKKTLSIDKIVAYGALFYLLMPLDFIPDYIPVFGYMDDLGVLTAAVLFYTKSRKNKPSF